MRFKILNKNKHLVLGILLCYGSVFSQTIEKLYVKMPDILNPTLSSRNRLELLEYHKAHQSDSTENRFGKKAFLVLLDTLNQHIIVKNTGTSTFDMKLIRYADSIPYIGIIRTVCAPVCMSTVEFYDTAWNLIPLQFFMPKAIEWINTNNLNPAQIDINWVKKLMGMSFITVYFQSENNTITVKNNTLDFLSLEDVKILNPLVSDKMFIYKLKGKNWVRE